jgi:hypothetical protein
MKTKTFLLPVLLPIITAGVALVMVGCTKQQSYQPVSAGDPVPPQVSNPVPPQVSAPVVVDDDDYVYYPQYEVYYSNRRHLYGYQEGGAWFWRPAPPRVEVNVLFASPSVHMDFRDSPERHHTVVIRNYPHNWRQPEHVDKDHRPDDRKH